ncbi:SIMPL domain-containing protein [Pseudomaricurvus sp.]|uniref:SIMPL domain-containing protein n=1 Tax=Pseudomaricurvus sp. TaxID=2004510 RepID=UPI003F6D4E51
MQKLTIKHSAVTLLCCVLSIGLYAASAQAEDQTPQVSSSATGVIEATPDIAIMNGKVMVQEETPEKAVSEARIKLDNVIRYIKSEGVKAEDLQAAQVLVNPIWHYQKDKPRQLTGYQAYADFTAKVRDVRKLSALYGGLIKAGVTELNPTSFDFSLREDLELQAISKAVELAKKKAEAGLKPLGQQVGDVLSMNVDTRWQQPPMYKTSRMVMSAEADMVGAAPEVNIGNQAIQATISVTFEVK